MFEQKENRRKSKRGRKLTKAEEVFRFDLDSTLIKVEEDRGEGDRKRQAADFAAEVGADGFAAGPSRAWEFRGHFRELGGHEA